MKYIKKLNIDFDQWNNIPIDTNEQQIKKLHPIFYKFLIEKNLLGMYLEMFDKCHWKDKGNTFKKIMNYYNNSFFYNPISFTLNYQCIRTNNLFNNISSLNNEFLYYFLKT
jgi:hypothetical protein